MLITLHFCHWVLSSGPLTRISWWGGFSVDALCRQCKSRGTPGVWWGRRRCRAASSPPSRKTLPFPGPCPERCGWLRDAWSCLAAPTALCRPCARRCGTWCTRILRPASARACPSCWWTRWPRPPPSTCCLSPPPPSCDVRRCSPRPPASRRWCRSVPGCPAAWRFGCCSAPGWGPLRGGSSSPQCLDPGSQGLMWGGNVVSVTIRQGNEEKMTVSLSFTHYILQNSSSSPTLYILKIPSDWLRQSKNRNWFLDWGVFARS